MPKGPNTQALAVLLKSPIPVEEIESLLDGRKIVKRMEAGEEGWQGPSVVVEFRPEVNGHVIVDVVGVQWPDHMGGNPEDGTESLRPPAVHCVVDGDILGRLPFLSGCRELCSSRGIGRRLPRWWRPTPHSCGFASAYVFGGAPRSCMRPWRPKTAIHLRNLDVLTDMARDVMNHPDALCYFNPSGEVLASSQHHPRISRVFSENVNLLPLGTLVQCATIPS